MNKILQLYLDNSARTKRPLNLVRNSAEATMYIYDVIDSYWGVSAAGVIDALAQVADAEVLHIYINSPGGDIFEGRAIMAAISRFKGKTIAHIDSLCASAATSIALSCDEVEMSAGSFFMIHNASSMAWGDKNVMRDTADLLEQIEGSIVGDYTTKTGKDAEQVVAWMNEETWFNADQALAEGFIDRIAASPVKPSASNAWNLAAFAKAPAALTAPAPAAEPAPTPEVIENALPDPAPPAEPAPLPSMSQANANRLALNLAL